jgi:hypothetical protein
MDLFTKLFGHLLVFVYHCFDRVVINGYLSGLSRPEQVVYFFREVVGKPQVDKAVLSQRTNDYQNWVEAYARVHDIPIQWAEKNVRKKDDLLAWLRPLERANRYGVYFILKSMEQGRTFRCSVPKFPTQDPNHRILARQKSRFTHYYFYIRNEVLGAVAMRVGSFFPFQATYYLNGHNFIEQELNRKRSASVNTTMPSSPSIASPNYRRSPTGSTPTLSVNLWSTGRWFWDRSSPNANAKRSICRASTRFLRSSTAETSSSSATFPSTRSSNAPVSWGCGA